MPSASVHYTAKTLWMRGEIRKMLPIWKSGRAHLIRLFLPTMPLPLKCLGYRSLLAAISSHFGYLGTGASLLSAGESGQNKAANEHPCPSGSGVGFRSRYALLLSFPASSSLPEVETHLRHLQALPHSADRFSPTL